MALFVDRQSQYPNRRRLIPVENENNVFDVERVEGIIKTEGTSWGAETMNKYFYEIQEFTPELFSHHEGIIKNLTMSEGARQGLFARVHNMCVLYIYIRRLLVNSKDAQGYYGIYVGNVLNNIQLNYRVGSVCSEAYFGDVSTSSSLIGQSNLFKTKYSEMLPSLHIIPSGGPVDGNINYLSLSVIDSSVNVQNSEISYYVDLICSIPFIIPQIIQN